MNVVAQNITKSYTSSKGQKKILNSFTASFNANEITILQGRSGSGKTTLLSILGLLENMDSGDLTFDDSKLSDMNAHEKGVFRRKTFSFIFQRSGLIDRFTIKQNLTLPLIYHRYELFSAERSIKNLLDRCHLYIDENRKVSDLSGGERLRVSIARALLLPSPVVICDEPTASLDIENTQIIGEELQRLSQLGRTVIVATHDPLMLNYAHKVITLDK